MCPNIFFHFQVHDAWALWTRQAQCLMHEGWHVHPNYPRVFQQTTAQSGNGYPLYRRREEIDGPVTRQRVELENRWVRSFPHLRCHICRYMAGKIRIYIPMSP